jgi:hypothetical protein
LLDDKPVFPVVYRQARRRLQNAGVAGDFLNRAALAGAADANAATLSFWIRRDEAPVSYRYILGAAPMNVVGCWARFNPASTITVSMRRADGSGMVLTSSTVFVVGAWHHVMMSGALGAGVNLWVDGEWQASEAWTVSPWAMAGATAWRIGNHAASVSYNFTGALGDVYMAGVALGPEVFRSADGVPLPPPREPRPWVLFSTAAEWALTAEGGTGGPWSLTGVLEVTT